MAVARVSASTLGFGTRSNSTLTAPASISDGNILLAILAIQASPDVSATLPTGFTAASGYADGLVMVRQGSDSDAASRIKLYVGWKRAASESGDYSWTHGSVSTAGVMLNLSGAVASGDPTDNPNASTNNGQDTSDVTALGVTTAVDGSFVVYACVCWDGSGATDPPAGTTPTFTEVFESFGNAFYVADGPMTTAGATGNKACSTQNIDNGWGATLIVIEAAAAAAPGLPITAALGGLPAQMIWDECGVF